MREIIPNEKQDCKFKYEWRGICVGVSREKRKYFNLKNKLKINLRKARQRRKKEESNRMEQSKELRDQGGLAQLFSIITLIIVLILIAYSSVLCIAQ